MCCICICVCSLWNLSQGDSQNIIIILILMPVITLIKTGWVELSVATSWVQVQYWIISIFHWSLDFVFTWTKLKSKSKTKTKSHSVNCEFDSILVHSLFACWGFHYSNLCFGCVTHRKEKRDSRHNRQWTVDCGLTAHYSRHHHSSFFRCMYNV